MNTTKIYDRATETLTINHEDGGVEVISNPLTRIIEDNSFVYKQKFNEVELMYELDITMQGAVEYNGVTIVFTNGVATIPKPPTTEQLTLQKLNDIELAQIEEGLKAETERQAIAQKQYDLELMMLEINMGGTTI